MRALLATLLLLVPAAVWAQASWLQIGDPQFGYRCGGAGAPYDSATNAAAFRYNDLGGEECLQKQMEQTIGLLEFAEDKNVDFVAFMGDMNNPYSTNQQAGSDTRLKMGELKALFPNVDIKWIIGNHDFEAGCQYLNVTLLDFAATGATDRIPAWEIWTINNVYFINIPVFLFSTDVADCAAGDQDRCEDIAGAGAAACTGSDPTDNYMQENCAGDEICTDFSGYTTAAWTAMGAQIDAWAAAGSNARLFTFGHWSPWWAHDTSSPPAGNFTTAWTQTWEDRVSLGVTSAVKPFTMLFGHWHENTILGQDVDSYWTNTNPGAANGVTTRKGVYYSAVVSGGPMYAKWLVGGFGEKHKLAAFYWQVDENGNHKVTRILAGPQRGGLK